MTNCLMAAAATAAMLISGASQAHLIEDIYTGDASGFNEFKAIFEYNDQIGDASSTVVQTGSVDPTVFASLKVGNDPTYMLATGAGSSSEYYTIPGYSIFSTFSSPTGDFIQFGGLTDAPSNLSTPHQDTAFSAQEGTYSIGGVSGVFFAKQLQVIVDPVASAVPEPAAWAMMIGGVGFVGGAVRRRTSKLAFA